MTDRPICKWGIFDRKIGKVICWDVTAVMGECCEICLHYEPKEKEKKEGEK